MSELTELLAQVDLVELIEEYYELKEDSTRYYRARQHDSLVVDTLRGKWYWNSRGISGDAIDWLTQVCGLSFGEAVRRLRLENSHPEPQLGKLPARQRPQTEPVNMAIQALECHLALMNHKARAMALQRDRCLRLLTIQQARLGWYNDGYIAGWTIPHWLNPKLRYGEHDYCSGIKVRCIEGPTRYRALPGSRFGLYTPVTITNPTFIVEGEFKALHIVQLGGCAVATNANVGGESFRAEWVTKVVKSQLGLVFAVRDNDLGGLAFLESVRRHIPHALALAPAAEYKGIDDWIVGARIRSLDQLITEGLNNV